MKLPKLSRVWRWLRESFPSDEQLPDNDRQIRERINENERLRAIARRQLAELDGKGKSVSGRMGS